MTCHRDRRAGRRAWLVPAIAGPVTAALVLVAVLQAGGSVQTRTLRGLPDPGPVTAWALPAATLAGRLAAVLTIGLLLGAAFLLPGTPPADPTAPGVRLLVSATGYRWVRAAAWTALAWSAASLAATVFTVSDLLGVPPGRVLGQAAGWSAAWSLQSARMLLLSAAAAALLAVAARTVLTVTGAAGLLALAAAGLLPPAFTGHASGAGNHQLATSAMLLHLLGVAGWAGGLAALLATGRLRTPVLAAAAARYSRLAGWCLILVAASGLASAWARLPTPATDLDSGYGRLLLTKTAALIALAAFGAAHRRRTLPALNTTGAGRRAGAAFRRLATVEVIVFAATIGLAVGLSRTPAPVILAHPGTPDALLGFPLPGPPTAGTLVWNWLPEPVLLTAGIAAILAYRAGLTRLRAADVDADRGWPRWRATAWYTGCGLLLAVTSGGLARYAPVLVTAHVVQQLTLLVVVPALLVLGAPLALATRALPASGDPAVRGAREWLLLIAGSALMRALALPVVAVAGFAIGPYLLYFTGWYPIGLRSHATHLATLLAMLAAGLAFWAALARTAPRSRIAAAAMASAAATALTGFGLTMMWTGTPLTPLWTAALGRTWGPPPVADQHTAGHLTIALTIALAVAAAVTAGPAVQLPRRTEEDTIVAAPAGDGA